jgi:light-harvesting complex 1 beta chain
MADKQESWTGLTDEEAQEFHNYYLQGAVLFTAVAVIAHVLVWSWRPWIPGPRGYGTSAVEGITSVASAALSALGIG